MTAVAVCAGELAQHAPMEQPAAKRHGNRLQARAAVAIALAAVLGAGCGSEDASPSKADSDHLWKDQARALDKARALEGALEGAAERRRSATE